MLSASGASLTIGVVAVTLVATGMVGHTAPPPVATPAPTAAAVLSLARLAPQPASELVSPAAIPTRSPSKSPTAAKPHLIPAPNLATGLKTLPATTTQVIIVHATSATTTTATLETFEKVKGAWVRKFGAMTARVGRDGLSDHHVEGTPNTPTGVYGFDSTFYGINANPGVHYTYHPLVANDWWDENSSSPTYNTFVHSATSPGGPSEALWKETTAYRYFAVIAYNESPVVPGGGAASSCTSAPGTPPPVACSLAQANLIKVLTWLNPSAKPPDRDQHRREFEQV